MPLLRPRALDWILAAFCAFASWATIESFWNGELLWSGNLSPYDSYNRSVGIRLITTAALAVDVLIVGIAPTWRFARLNARPVLAVLVVLALIGAALTWAELWYGSTFYYGEVRDKQGLPYGVNNGGVLGSCVFLGWLGWRLARTIQARIGLLAVLLLAHVALLRIVSEPWQL